MCIYRCDTSPCVSIATSALKSAPSHAPPVGAGRGYRSRGLWARPRLRVARGALTGARLPPNGTTTIPRWSGRSSSSPGIGRICTTISSARSPGTRPCECSSIGASENGGGAPAPRQPNCARVSGARPVRSKGGCDVPGILPELSRLGCGDFPALLLCVHLIDERVESAAGGTIIGRVRVGQERCDLAQGADEARLLLGRERAPDGLDQARAGVGRREDDEHASSLGAHVEGGGTPGIDDYGT